MDRVRILRSKFRYTLPVKTPRKSVAQNFLVTLLCAGSLMQLGGTLDAAVQAGLSEGKVPTFSELHLAAEGFGTLRSHAPAQAILPEGRYPEEDGDNRGGHGGGPMELVLDGREEDADGACICYTAVSDCG